LDANQQLSSPFRELCLVHDLADKDQLRKRFQLTIDHHRSPFTFATGAAVMPHNVSVQRPRTVVSELAIYSSRSAATGGYAA
jgi:hypothetical protein